MENLYDFIQNDEVNEGLFGNAISLIELRHMEPEHLLEGILDMYDYIVDKDDIDLFYQDMPSKERPFWKNLYTLYTKQVWSMIDAPFLDQPTPDQVEFLDGDVETIDDDTREYVLKKLNKRSNSFDNDDEEDAAIQNYIDKHQREIQRFNDQREREAHRNASQEDKQQELVSDIFRGQTNALIKVTPEFRRKLRELIKNSRNNELDLKPSAPEWMTILPDEVKNCSYILTINRASGLLRRLLGTSDRVLLQKAFSRLNGDMDQR